MFSKHDMSILHKTKQKFVKKLIKGIDPKLFDHYTSRVKTNESIKNKLRKKNIPVSCENAIENLNDVIGIRIITHYTEEIYTIIDYIKQNYDVVLEKDYIKNPKENGYRSYHIIVKAPIIQPKKDFSYAEDINIEIQIRTMGMDFWASIEHYMFYDKKKKNRYISNIDMSYIQQQMASDARKIFDIDMHMQQIRHNILMLQNAQAT